MARLREALPPSTALVSLLHSGDRWWALVLSREGQARFVPFAERDLGLLAYAWKLQLRHEPVRLWEVEGGRLRAGFPRPDGASGPHLAADEIAARLGVALAGPLAAATGGARRWVVVADDELVGVPLQALPLGAGLLGDGREFVYAPSITTWAHAHARAGTPGAKRSLLAIGGVEPASASEDGGTAAGAALPHAREEIEAIAAAFPRSGTTLWMGGAATRQALLRASLDGSLARYRYVHIASHASTRPDPPEASSINLSPPPGSPKGKPSGITAAQFAGLAMDADLVTLSACDTGAGRYEHGRGLLGLAYAALAAGNRAALLSLWPVEDDATARFMARFYALLRSGEDPSAALAKVQREWAGSADPRMSDPRTWAAFVLWGGA
jgi:CHAT domain-containing protein